MVINREYSNIEYKIKKTREKLYRIKAKLYDHRQAEPNEEKQGTVKMGKWIEKQLELSENIQHFEQEIEKSIGIRQTNTGK